MKAIDAKQFIEVIKDKTHSYIFKNKIIIDFKRVTIK